MRQIDFNDLPRTTRELFVRSLLSDSPASSPICRRAAVQRGVAVWYILFIASLIGLGAVAYPHFGSLSSPVQGPRLLGAYVALFAVMGLSLSMVLRRRSLKGSLPFAPGVYVFPLDLVDARSRELELYPLAELQSIDPVHHQKGGTYTHTSLWFVFPSQSFVFEVRNRARAELELAAITRARQEISLLGPHAELLSKATFDPFAEARARHWEPAHDHGLLARGRPLWTRFVWAIMIVCGLIFGVAGWRVRNWQSDERAFSKLRAKPDIATAEVYIRAGGLRAVEVKNVVLPRARLAEAMKETAGSKRADAIDRFLRTYPKTGVESEARAALAETLHMEFVAQTTVSGLRAFVSRWPDSPDVAAARTKMRDMHQQTLVDFRQHANLADKSVVPVMEALLTWAEANPIPLEVRFRRRNAASLAATDKLLTKGLLDDDGSAKNGNAEIALHFTGEEIAERETGVVRAFERGFAGVFPADVLAFRVGLPLDDAGRLSGGATTKPLPEVTAPTIVVDYEVGWSGTTYVARDAGRRFVGFFVKCEVTVQVPTEPRVLAFAMKVEPPESFSVDTTPADATGAPLMGKPKNADVRIYDAMMQRAFDQMALKLMAVVFDARTAASRAPVEPL